MEVLLIGGREFLGRSIVENLKANGHKITLFNRGRTNPALYAELELIQGDRQKDFHLFAGRHWDAVVDTCGYFPKDVSAFAQALGACADHYIFISSCSVYDFNAKDGIRDESAPLVSLDIDPADATWDTYGARKYLCEQAIDETFRGRSTHIRPGLIVGPFDSTYRFPYWGDRIAEGGVILAPGYFDAPTQFLDARDLGKWIVHVIENRLLGCFNAMGPQEPISLGQFLETAVAAVRPGTKLEWVPEDFLKQQKVNCWGQLPLWIYKEIEIFTRRDFSKAAAHGLKCRPVAETVRDTLAWSRAGLPTEFKSSALSREREREVLAAWAER